MNFSTDEDFDDLPQVSSLNVHLRNSTNKPSSKHDGDQEEDAGGDVQHSVVASHYNARPQGSIVERSRSAIIQTRLFNNWVKSILIKEFVRGRALKVLDLACGKGGDLGKWDRLSVTHYVGVGNIKNETSDYFLCVFYPSAHHRYCRGVHPACQAEVI